MKPAAVPCAIYTRKSSEEGLEQDFNSLDAQREACAAFILSQKALGWVASREIYDDGGFSGGNVERPALQRLMANIAAKRVRVVVVYKVDRLTRSLADFAKMVELFDAHGVSFVSVTQQFNTTSSMGRLTLNVLLSFAQFEREVTGERIRDKIAASKRKGMWMGGCPPVGYVANERSLAIDVVQAERIREIFRLYLEFNCVRRLKEELDRRAWMTPQRNTRRQGHGGGRPFSRGHLYRILSNPVYIGQIVHKSEVFAGNHPAVVDRTLWQAVQDRLALNQQGQRLRANTVQPSLLAGLIFDAQEQRLTPSHAQKGSRRYRYYVGRVQSGVTPASALRIPAQELEAAVVRGVQDFLIDDGRLLACLGVEDARAAQAQLHQAKVLAAQLTESPMVALARCVDRCVVAADSIEVSIKLNCIDGPAKPCAIISLPIQIKRCGMAVRLILQSSRVQAQRTPDAKMTALLAKAHDWAGRLMSGAVNSISELARAEGVGSSYVNRVVHLAFLAPDIVQAIARGEQPMELNASRLIAQVPLPIDWSEQRRLLGFAR